MDTFGGGAVRAYDEMNERFNTWTIFRAATVIFPRPWVITDYTAKHGDVSNRLLSEAAWCMDILAVAWSG